MPGAFYYQGPEEVDRAKSRSLKEELEFGAVGDSKLGRLREILSQVLHQNARTPRPPLPEFHFTKPYDGKLPASIWMDRLVEDFAKAGTDPIPPSLSIRSINLMWEGNARAWLESQQIWQRSVRNRDSTTPEDVGSIIRSAKARFPDKMMNLPEPLINDQIRRLSQNQDKLTDEFYNRTQNC